MVWLLPLLALGLVLFLGLRPSGPEPHSTTDGERFAPDSLPNTAIADGRQDADTHSERDAVVDAPRVGGILETYTVDQEVRVACKTWIATTWLDLGERVVARDASERWVVDRNGPVRVDWGYGEAMVEVRSGLVTRCRVGGEPAREIHGSVRTVGGQPLADMTVWAYEHRGLFPGVQTTSDAEGRWTLAVGSQAAVITCSGDGYACVRDFRLVAGDAQPEVLLVARPCTSRIRGICVDRDGKPLPRVLVYADGGARDQDSLPDALSVSRPDGTFDVGMPANGWPRNGMLVASKPGFTLWCSDLHRLDAKRPVTVVLGPAQKVKGRLLHLDGRPVPGATILVEGLAASTLAENRPDWTTDESGSWTMDRIAGAVALRAMDSGHNTLAARAMLDDDWEGSEIVMWARPLAPSWRVLAQIGSLARDGDRIHARSGDDSCWHSIGPRSLFVHGYGNQSAELELIRDDEVVARERVLGLVTKLDNQVLVFEGQQTGTVALTKKPGTETVRCALRSGERTMSCTLERERAEIQVPIGTWTVEWNLDGIPAGTAGIDVVEGRVTILDCTGLDDWTEVSLEHRGAGTLVWRTATAIGFLEYHGGPVRLPRRGAFSLSFQNATVHANLQSGEGSGAPALLPTEIVNPCVVYAATAQDDVVLDDGTRWFGLRGVSGTSVVLPAGTYRVLALRSGRLEERHRVTMVRGDARPLVLP